MLGSWIVQLKIARCYHPEIVNSIPRWRYRYTRENRLAMLSQGGRMAYSHSCINHSRAWASVSSCMWKGSDRTVLWACYFSVFWVFFFFLAPSPHYLTNQLIASLIVNWSGCDKTEITPKRAGQSWEPLLLSHLLHIHYCILKLFLHISIAMIQHTWSLKWFCPTVASWWSWRSNHWPFDQLPRAGLSRQSGCRDHSVGNISACNIL